MYVEADEGDFPSEKVDKLGVLRPLSLPPAGDNRQEKQKGREQMGWGAKSQYYVSQLLRIFNSDTDFSDLITQPFTVSVKFIRSPQICEDFLKISFLVKKLKQRLCRTLDTITLVKNTLKSFNPSFSFKPYDTRFFFLNQR